MKTRSVIIEIIIGLLVILWVYAAISKWLESRLIYQLTSSHLIGYNFGHILYWALPIGELVIAALLLFEPTKKLGLILSAGLLSIFIGYIIYILTLAMAVPCSCGGIIAEFSWKQHLVFNALYLLLNLIGILLQQKKLRESKVAATQ
jgi:hypothetical protein